MAESSTGQAEVGEQHIELWQKAPHRDESRAMVAIFSDATVAVSVGLENEQRGDYSIVNAYVIDRSRVEEALRAVCQFAVAVHGHIHKKRLAAFFVWAELRGIEQRMMGTLPTSHTGGISIPMHRLGPTMKVPAEPTRVSLEDLQDGVSLAADLVERAARKFKAANCYYSNQ